MSPDKARRTISDHRQTIGDAVYTAFRDAAGAVEAAAGGQLADVARV